MNRIRHCSLLVVPFVALVSLLGCGGADDEAVIVIEWQAKDSARLETSLDSEAIQTVVYLTNSSDKTLRDVRLRLPPVEGGPPDLSFGTVAAARTHFEADAYVWQLGDLAPHTRVAFPLGLWFDSDIQHVGELSIELSLQVLSADMEEAISSKPLLIAAVRP